MHIRSEICPSQDYQRLQSLEETAVSDIQSESTEHVGIQERPQPHSTDYERFTVESLAVGTNSSPTDTPPKRSPPVHMKRIVYSTMLLYS